MIHTVIKPSYDHVFFGGVRIFNGTEEERSGRWKRVSKELKWWVFPGAEGSFVLGKNKKDLMVRMAEQ